MRSLAGLVFLLSLVPFASAQRQVFVVNPDASVVKMTLNTTHEVVHGTFHLVSGAIGFDRSTMKMSGSVIVAAGSGKTGSGSRDKRMNKEILQVEKHVTVSFAPQSYTGVIAPSGDSTIQITGVFTLLDTPHEIAVPAHIHLENGDATVTAHLQIPYVKWGVKDPGFLIWKADKDVAIDLSLAGKVVE